MSDELLSIGQLSNQKRLVETSTTEVVAELVATWAQASTASMGILGASTAVVGHVIADASTAITGYVKIDQTTPGTSNGVVAVSTAGASIFTTGVPGKVQALASTEVIGHVIADASTAPIGQVGGHTAFPVVNLVTTTSAYDANDVVGGLLSFANAFRSTSIMSGVLHTVTIADKSTAQAPLDLLFIQTATTGSTFTDNAAITVADGDLAKLLGKVSVVAADYISFADNSLATKSAIGFPVQATTGTSLAAVVINRSTGHNYASTGDLIITLGILQD